MEHDYFVDGMFGLGRMETVPHEQHHGIPIPSENIILDIGQTAQSSSNKTVDSVYASDMLKLIYYDDANDANDLRSLLASWNLVDLFEFFSRKYNCFHLLCF